MSKITIKVPIALTQDELETILNALHEKANSIAFNSHESDEEAWATYREITALQSNLTAIRNDHPFFLGK